MDWLFTQFPSYQKVGLIAYKPSLVNIQNLLNLLSLPIEKLKYVHVAGTNGKGSVVNFTASTMVEAGYKTGVFTSPHIVDFRERIRVNGQCISEQKVNEFIQEIRSKHLELGAPSFFEITWALALKHFIDENVAIAIIETGLGGRLDATNVIQPLISVITNIGLDHTQLLGPDRPSIAKEKAGIIKKNIPVIIGELNDETKEVFEHTAKTQNAPLSFVSYPSAIQFPERNKMLANKIIQGLNSCGFALTEEHFERGQLNLFKNTGFFGRLQKINQDPPVFVDAAHNVEGVKALLKVIHSMNCQDLHLVYGASSDKNINQILSLFPKDAKVYFCSFSSERSCKKEDFYPFISNLAFQACYYSSPKDALEAAQIAVKQGGMIFVFGSFFLLEDIFKK
ncbi:MAG: bifunctional folylpolyglutamate synthase/dihydrofolate synthase [Crocinitomicaceae bacterium]|nr:bifunctional folylpolyglutamate synthase/dihydrofolate synthase [Crocinitomicaceae bacterium]